MSKIFSPKAWYLVAIGGVALVADGARRLVKKRRQAAENPPEGRAGTEIPMMSFEPTRTAPAKQSPITEPLKTTNKVKADEIKKAPKPVKSPAEPAKPDDLTEINGIGPTFAKRLAEAGITTFAAIASSTPEHLREVTHATAVAKPEEWIAQARLR